MSTHVEVDFFVVFDGPRYGVVAALGRPGRPAYIYEVRAWCADKTNAEQIADALREALVPDPEP